MIEKHEGADHTPRRGGQHTPDLEPAETAATLPDHGLDHPFLPCAQSRQPGNSGAGQTVKL
jgi:hypothetical protein